MKNVGKRTFPCKNRLRYSRDRAISEKNAKSLLCSSETDLARHPQPRASVGAAPVAAEKWRLCSPHSYMALPMVRKFGKFCSGAKVRKSCRPQKSLQHEHLLAKVGFDKAENESFTSPPHVLNFSRKAYVLIYTSLISQISSPCQPACEACVKSAKSGHSPARPP